jgi:hypothetical protein
LRKLITGMHKSEIFQLKGRKCTWILSAKWDALRWLKVETRGLIELGARRSRAPWPFGSYPSATRGRPNASRACAPLPRSATRTKG